MKNAARWVNSLLALVLLTLLGLFALHKYLHHSWHQPSIQLAEPYTLNIADGTTTTGLIKQLQQDSLLENVLPARIAQRLFHPGFVLKRGEYRLHGSLSLDGIFATLHAGVSAQYRLTLVEGQTLKQWLAGLEGAEGLEQDVENIEALAALLQPAAGSISPAGAVEGWFAPDTYYFSAGDRLSAVLQRAHSKMLADLMQAWQDRAEGLPYQSPYEALVMASLIERETGVLDEQPTIAGVFVRRLQKNMRLQTDPTVIYGMGERYRGNLTRADLRRDTPYNTYTRHGLPPTPIAAPGRSAIHAAMHPAEGTALYFVAKGNGEHQFSDTLEEHQKAVRHYQINNRRSDYRSAPPAKSSQDKG